MLKSEYTYVCIQKRCLNSGLNKKFPTSIKYEYRCYVGIFLQKLKKMFLETPPLWIIEVWKIAYVNRGVRHCVKYQTKEKVLNFPSGSSMGLCGLAPKEKKCILPKIYLHHVLLYASKCYKIGVKAAKICHFSHFQNFLQLI